MKVAQIGNFRPDHSTENELRRAMEDLGYDVTLYQEDDGAFRRLTPRVSDYDFVLWTRTGWDPPVPADDQYRLLLAAERAEVPTVGYHLDRWWGLKREGQVDVEPFFRCRLVITADGGHDDLWEKAGVEHLWMPPAVSAFECQPGTFDPELASDLAFVGSWRPGYHREWTHRPALIDHLQTKWGDRVRFWPAAGQPAVRGQKLRDLYASVKLVIGDSCLVGAPARYWSDRVPETTGRGGFLIHPRVEGLDVSHPSVVQWPVGAWSLLDCYIEAWLSATADERVARAEAMRAETLAHHTYTVRMANLVGWLEDSGQVMT